MFRRKGDRGSDSARGVQRRCHLTGQVRTARVWYTRTLTEDGVPKRVYASPEAFFELPGEARATYQRLVSVQPADGQRPTRRTPVPAAPPAEQPPSAPPRPRSEPAGDPVQTGEVVVEARGLAKTYPDGTEAVKGVSFRVRKGEIFGLLGPNGAGKSTLIGMLGTLVKPTAGQAFVAGIDVVEDPGAVKPVLGFAMQEVGVDELATGREFLEIQARLFGLKGNEARERARELLALVGLTEAAGKRIASYSGGMKRKVDLASALLHRPDVIFLDEPTEGLDPRARQELWALLFDLRDELGATVLLSTHYMEEADHLCDRLAIIDQGQLVARGTPEALKGSIGRQSIVLAYEPPDQEQQLDRARTLLEAAGLDGNVKQSATELHVYVDDPARATPKVLRVLDEADHAPASLQVQRASLDDVYLHYTGYRIEEVEAEVVA